MRSRIVCISDVLTSQRLDVTYHSEDQFLLGFVPLSNYISINGGKRLPKGKTFSSEKTSYLYLRLADIVDLDNIDYTKLPFINETIFNTLKRYEIKEGEVSISIAGTIGKVFITKNIPMGKRVILTENCAVIRPKAQSLSPIFLKLLLNCTFVQQQIKRNSIQTTIPKIGLDRIGKLRIPVIPPIHIQENIINIYTKAQEAKQAKDKEAKDLSSNIDSFVLKKMGISLPSEDISAKENVISLSRIVGKRYDPYYHKAYFAKAFKCLKETTNYNLVRLSEISTLITSGITPKSGGEDYTDSEHGVAFIRSGNIDIMGEVDFDNLLYIKREVHETRMKSSKVKEGDIMIAIVGATIGQVGIYHSSREANINQAIALVRLNEGYNPEYIKEVIKSSIGQLNLDRLKRPVARANINLEEISSMLIPVPEMEIQNDIVKSIVSIRLQVKQLQMEGTVMLEKAKQEIEKLILGL